jgi:ribose/xylose/arabinose/galactoside ABC-type transport system permease subunit
MHFYRKEGVIVNKVKSFITDNVALVGLVVVILIGILVSSSFFTLQNLTNVLRSASIMGIVSAGMTFVILCGSIDLSVSSVFSLGGYFFIALSKQSVVMALLVPLIVGAIVGLVNGFLINKMSIPAFVGTLATMLFVRGLVLMLTHEVSVKVDNLPYILNFIGRGMFFGTLFSFPLVLFIIVVIITSFVLKKRSIGRAMYIVGGNAEAAKLMGVSVPKTMFTAHALSGFMAAFAGIISASRVGSAVPLAGTGYELYAIAAVVIGGAPLTGGVGKMTGTFFGALIMGSFTNIFSMQKLLDPLWEKVVVGVILLAVVFLQSIVGMYGTASKKKGPGFEGQKAIS